MAYGASYNRTSLESNMMSTMSKNFLGSGAMNAFGQGRRFGQDKSASGVGSLLGSDQDNVGKRQGMSIGADGQPRRGSATDAILYRQARVAGKFGYRTQDLGRYRNRTRTMRGLGKLSQSGGPNKAPHGVAQSSLDSTRESYSTIETRFGMGDVLNNRAEKWNEETERFERQWKGFDKLDIKQRGQHYAQGAAKMFKVKNTNVGAARRGDRIL